MTELRGAHTAADVVRPEIGITIEGGVAGDVPGAQPEETQARLGAGPGVFSIIKRLDAGTVRRLRDFSP